MALSHQPLPRFMLSPQMARDPLTIMLPTAAATWIWPMGGTYLCHLEWAVPEGRELAAGSLSLGPSTVLGPE